MNKWIERIIDGVWKAFLATLVVVAVWALTKVFLLASYSIPTDSMEPTLTPGDYILVDKTYMGARLFSLNAAFEQRPFTMHRMWGRHRLQVGDVAVFNYPYPQTPKPATNVPSTECLHASIPTICWRNSMQTRVGNGRKR